MLFRKNVNFEYMKTSGLSKLDANEAVPKGRRKKKANAKLLEEQYNEYCADYMEEDFGILKEPRVNKVKKMYECLPHMSKKEQNEFDKKFVTPKTDSQTNYVRLLKDTNKKIVVANGPAGTGKTLFATEYGIRYFLTDTYEKLIFTRPSVSVDEDLGYLPGTLEEKMAPWVRPIYDILHKFFSSKQMTYMMEEKIIEIVPLGFMRGRTFQNAWIVADEMQNSTVAQMKMLLTRLGDNSRLVVTGDLDQHDNGFNENGLNDFLNRFRGRRSGSISSFEFTKVDVQREEVVKEILDIYGKETLDIMSDDNSMDESET